jgi:3-phytase
MRRLLGCLTFPIAVVLSLLAPPRSAWTQEPRTFRVATFNASLNRDRPGKLLEDLKRGDDPQIRNVAEIIQRVRPDILLINEFDYVKDGSAARLFQQNYLSHGQNGAQPIEYPYVHVAPVNTGVFSGHDLDRNEQLDPTPGSRAYGGDCLGFGLFPGQYGMVVFTRFPIEGTPRSFQSLKWAKMPGALLPAQPSGEPWYGPDALAVLPLSSKSHWDIPIRVESRIVHLLASHPTPPAFDGPEDRNGKRNHDEIRLWADYVSGGEHARYLVADGESQPAAAPEHFIILGDLNADPYDGGSAPGAIDQLLMHPRVDASFVPTSKGAVESAVLEGEANTRQKADPARDTANFSDREPGNLRVDYVLPSRTLSVRGGGVFWPLRADPLARLVAMEPDVASSDHRLVWLDLAIAPGSRP